MENIDKNNLEVSESVIKSLDTMVYWSKFLAILGYIVVGFMVLGAFLIFGMNNHSYNSELFTGVIYLIIAVLYFFPANYLYNFATNTRRALSSDSQTSLNDGLSNLASNFKFVGVMAIVVLSFYALIFIMFFFSLPG